MDRYSFNLALGALLLLTTNTPPLTSATAATAQHVDVAGMDKSVNPGDDFFAYANGGWIKTTPIPADRPAYGVDTIIEEIVNKRTAALIRTAGESKDAEALKVGTYYAAFMDEEGIEQKGLRPLKSDLDAIDAISDRVRVW